MATKKNNQKPSVMHRQGDILFVKFESLPNAPLTERKSAIIVEGEVTGHAHKLVEGRILETAQGLLFLAIASATQVVHEEHHAINLEPGYYQVIRQREYTPDAIRLVVD